MKHFIRARKPEQKDERRTQLLASARERLRGGVEVGDLSLSEIARSAGIAKSGIYRYFETREALLLSLLWDEWEQWYAELVDGYRSRCRGQRAVDALVTHLARSLAQRPLLCALTAALPAVVERNLSEESVIAFKLQALRLFRNIAAFCHERAPALSRAAYARLVHDTVPLLAGLYPCCYPARTVAHALSAPELAFFRRDFSADLERMLLAFAHAMTRKT